MVTDAIAHWATRNAVALVVLELVAPIAIGGLAWSRVRRRGSLGRLAWVVGALALVSVAIWALPALRLFSAYDVLLPPVFLAIIVMIAALAAGRGVMPWPTRIASLIILTAGIGGMELLARQNPERQVRSMALMPTVFPDSAREFGFAAIYPERGDRSFPKDYGDPARWPRTPGVRRVLHVGDSVVGAADTPPGTTFEEVLAQTVGGEHLNLGTSNTSTDFELQVLRTWVDRLRPDEVVLHVYTGNDIEEMDRAFLFCDDGPLLGSTAEGLPLRCPEPRFRITRRWLLTQGPAPLALRALAPYSALAHRMLGGFERAIRVYVPSVGEGQQETERQWMRYRDCLRAAHDEMTRRGIPLHVIVLPDRSVVVPGINRDSYEENKARAERAFGLAREAGVDPLDPTQALAAAIRDRPSARWFSGGSPHFYVDGHAFYAQWLAQQLHWARRATPGT